jgi:hypothetical protein
VHQQEIEKKLAEMMKAVESVEKNRQEDKSEGNKSLCEFKEKYDLSLASIEQIVQLNNTETLLKISNILSKLELLDAERANSNASQSSPSTTSAHLMTPIAGPERETNPAESKTGESTTGDSGEWKAELEGLKSVISQTNEKIRLELGTL